MKSIKITLEELSDILAVSKIVDSNKYADIQVHLIEHLTIGRAITVHPSGNGALIISGMWATHYFDSKRFTKWLKRYYDFEAES
jgi:hypothetical protein